MKKITRFLIAIFLLVGLAVLGIAFVPASPYKPPTRDLQDESAFDLETKVGWYREEDGALRLLTWGAERGLVLYGFGSNRDNLRRSAFVPTSTSSMASPEPSDNRHLEFVTNEAGLVKGARLSTPAGMQLLQRTTGPYRTEEVTFGRQGVELSGLLFLPNGPGPHPAVAFIHGSGSSNRDAFWYLSPADHLARRGVVVLLPDKRGSGKSGGEWHRSSFGEFAADAEDATTFLAELTSVDKRRIGLVGFSQGGWITPLAATRSPHVAFVVTVSGSMATPSESLAYEVERDIVESGAPEVVAELIGPLFARRAKMRREDWWSMNGTFDPVELWRQVDVPALILLGERDQNVDVARSLRAIDAAGLRERGSFRVRVFPGLAHGLIREDSGWLEPEYLEAMTDFVLGYQPQEE